MGYVDTSFWVALQFRRDPHRAEARLLWREQPGALITTNPIVGETWTHLNRRLGHYAPRDFLDNVEQSPRVTIHRVNEAAEREAWEWLRRHDERVYSFGDATSFAVMRRLGLLEVLAFDGDFRAAGFVEVRPYAPEPSMMPAAVLSWVPGGAARVRAACDPCWARAGAEQRGRRAQA